MRRWVPATPGVALAPVVKRRQAVALPTCPRTSFCISPLRGQLQQASHPRCLNAEAGVGTLGKCAAACDETCRAECEQACSDPEYLSHPVHADANPDDCDMLVRCWASGVASAARPALTMSSA